jgi:hypothetical protein
MMNLGEVMLQLGKIEHAVKYTDDAMLHLNKA